MLTTSMDIVSAFLPFKVQFYVNFPIDIIKIDNSLAFRVILIQFEALEERAGKKC